MRPTPRRCGRPLWTRCAWRGFAPEVLNRLDRIFVFRALGGLDVARVAALEIEAMIASYGLDIAAGGIDPALLFEVMQRQDRLGRARAPATWCARSRRWSATG